MEVTILILIFAAVIVALCSDAVGIYFEKHEYPTKYDKYVDLYSNEFGVDKNLVYAIIKAESNFKDDAVSSAGAIGLMQIMPATYIYDIKDALGMSGDESNLYDPAINIRSGVYYISRLIEHFNDVRAAIAAYNAGIGNVSKWLEDAKICDDGKLITENVPFYETRVYINRVEYYYEQYTSLYPLDNTDSTNNFDKYKDPLYLTVDEAYIYAKKYGEMYDVDPCLVLAIMNIESSFNAHALSSSNAMGLMQIKPSTYFGDIRHALGTSEDESVLFDPDTNAKCGTYYLHWLSERLEGNRQIILAYYYGIGNVLRMLESEEYTKDGVNIIYDSIPNTSAKSYLKRVLQKYIEYREIYGKTENNF